jgi:2-isopropylmalate synthase
MKSAPRHGGSLLAVPAAPIGGGARPHILALIESGAPVAVIVGKSSRMHVTEVLNTTLSENHNMTASRWPISNSAGREVLYDAEHFFDGYKT